MSDLKKFLRLAHPQIPAEIIEGAASELLGNSNGGISKEAFDEAVENSAMFQEEIGRLNTEIIRHKDGVQNATKAGLDVLGERARQRRLEGYDDAHDDGHDDFALSAAAIAYVTDARLRATTGKGFDQKPPAEWQWGEKDWKPKAIRKSLVVAAALLVAEIERLDRSGSPR